MPQQKQSQQQNAYQSLNIPTPPPRREAPDKGKGKSRPTPADKKAERDFVMEIKALAVRLDKSNQDKVIFYRGFKDWWQIGGRSLLFYFHYLMPEFGVRAINPRLDNDYFSKWPSNPGCASVHNVSEIQHQLINRVGAELLVEHPGLLIYRLPHKFTHAEVKAFLSIQAVVDQRTNSLILPKNVFPGTRNACDLLAKAIFDKIRNLDPFTRTTLGHDIWFEADWVARNHIAMVNGHISTADFYREVYVHLDRLQDLMVHTERYPIFDQRTRAKIAESIVEIRERMQNDEKQLQAAGGKKKLEQKIFGVPIDPSRLPSARPDKPTLVRSPNRKPRQPRAPRVKRQDPQQTDLFGNGSENSEEATNV